MTVPGAPSTARSWRYACGLGIIAGACGILLGGVSAWFLGSVAIAGLSTATALTFNFFAPGALVRLFAVGRTVTRYGERLVGHKAALGDQVAHRADLFAAMAAAPSTRQAGWQLGDLSRLADFLDDVEDIDYARLRATLPAMTLACGLVACAAATAYAAPFALLPITLLLLAILLMGRRTAAAGAMVWEQARSQRRGGAARLGATMASVVPLRAECAWNAERREILKAFCSADAAVLALRRMQSALDMLGVAFGPVACLAAVAAAWIAGGRGEALLLPMFVAFAWLALGESLNGVSRIVVADLRRQAAERSIVPGVAVTEELPEAQPESIATLAAGPVRRHAPDGRPIGAPMAFRVRAGSPTVLAGVSGSGKTSLLKQIAGWTGDDVLSADGLPVAAAARRAASTLCLHDAAILEDTIRANLFSPDATDGDLREALAAVEMDGRIAKAGGLDAWIRQDQLSLGEAQRLNIARAWLSDRPIVLLDEPIEHLDEEQGQRILRRLIERLRDRIVVVASHRSIACADTDLVDLNT
ncbi:ATP-binding cassette domain-containing protein [Mesorhizobium sp. ASY16-5R]|uniref:ATP-binding cassette domain-containing protein n=1 Tax=Mesorhizobium sp. ASY16-5R TaxID=3445772 RepID=UPI003F9F275A